MNAARRSRLGNFCISCSAGAPASSLDFLRLSATALRCSARSLTAGWEALALSSPRLADGFAS